MDSFPFLIRKSFNLPLIIKSSMESITIRINHSAYKQRISIPSRKIYNLQLSKDFPKIRISGLSYDCKYEISHQTLEKPEMEWSMSSKGWISTLFFIQASATQLVFEVFSDAVQNSNSVSIYLTTENYDVQNRLIAENEFSFFSKECRFQKLRPETTYYCVAAIYPRKYEYFEVRTKKQP